LSKGATQPRSPIRPAVNDGATHPSPVNRAAPRYRLHSAPFTGLECVAPTFRAGRSLGCSISDVNDTLSVFLGSLYVNSFNEFGRYWQVTLQADGAFRTRLRDLDLLQVRNKWGQMLPLGTLVSFRHVNGPVLVTRYNLYPAAAVTGTIRPGAS